MRENQAGLVSLKGRVNLIWDEEATSAYKSALMTETRDTEATCSALLLSPPSKLSPLYLLIWTSLVNNVLVFIFVPVFIKSWSKNRPLQCSVS